MVKDMKNIFRTGMSGAVLLALAPAAPAANPIRVMLLDGQSGGAYHAWQLTTPVLKKELQETGLFQATMPAVIANVLGLPAVAVPMGTNCDGLPVGVQLVGRPFEDERLLELGVWLEKSRG